MVSKKECLSRFFLVSLLTLGSGCYPEVIDIIPDIPTPRSTPTSPSETPTVKPEIARLALEKEMGLPEIISRFPVFDNKDPYFPWYNHNGGEKLFDPLAIPRGTSLFIPPFSQDIETIPFLPEITVSPEKWSHQLAFNVTSLEGSSAARMQNIEIAVENLNGIIIEPFRLFSMNETLEPFTEEEGYTMGWGYTPEGEVPMFAGGICQLPSTLFKPALEAGMLVVSRHAHLYYSSRYEVWDATIGGGIDFTFRNLYDFPVQIRAEIQEQDLVMGIWSSEMIPYDQIETEVLYDQPKDDGVREAAVRQTIVWDGRERTRDYYSCYVPKPNVSMP